MTNQVFDVDDPCPNQPSAYENRQAAELYRDARLWRENQQALADARTLDAAATPKSFWRTTPALNCWECCRMVWADSGWRSAEELFDGLTPEDARAKAAAWVREQKQ